MVDLNLREVGSHADVVKDPMILDRVLIIRKKPS